MSIYSKWVWPIVVPTGGYDFVFEQSGSYTATVPAATYASIFELCSALQTAINTVILGPDWVVEVSSAGIVRVTSDNGADWSLTYGSTDDALESILGLAGTETTTNEGGGEYTIYATSTHLYGWYPGVISFGSTAGAAHTDESDWVPSWPRAEGVSGSGQMRRVLPSRPPWTRVVGWDLLLDDEILDPDRGIHAMATQAVQSTVRFYPDRDVGTVATPGTQGDPHDDPRDSETDYWLCYLDADLDWQLHGMSGAYRQLTLTIHGEPD